MSDGQRPARRWIAGAAGLVALAVAAILLGTSSPESTVPSAPPSAVAAPPSTSAACGPAEPFVPASVEVGGVGAREVQDLPPVHEGDGIYRSPEPLDADPDDYAWDNEMAKPHEPGSVVLTAHTIHNDPDALGNRLLDELGDGDVIRLRGENGALACYRVTEQVETTVVDYPVDRIYGPAADQVVLTVCSGWDGSEWTERTIWFAEPL